jgi:molybdate transport system ATP-binding protein
MSARPHAASGTAPGLQAEVVQGAPFALQCRLHCAPGELLALVGPSGAGKTSLLRVLAGLSKAPGSRIEVAGTAWADPDRGLCLPPQQRRVGLVFQHYALMPHLSALDNVALALLARPTAERRAAAATWLHRVGLDDAHQRRRPAQLSGGQQQRVAVARALAREPDLLLLDEPFSAVDQMTRQGLYELLADLRRGSRLPIVLVTHDLAEARLLADRLVVMDGGRVLQEGSALQIGTQPRNARVADLVGIRNRFAGRWLGPSTEAGEGRLQWEGADGSAGPVFTVRDKRRLDTGQPVTWVIANDGLNLAEDCGPTPEGCDDLAGRVTQARHLGDISIITVEPEGMRGQRLELTLAGARRRQWAEGAAVCVRLDRALVHVMPVRTGEGAL